MIQSGWADATTLATGRNYTAKWADIRGQSGPANPLTWPHGFGSIAPTSEQLMDGRRVEWASRRGKAR